MAVEDLMRSNCISSTKMDLRISPNQILFKIHYQKIRSISGEVPFPTQQADRPNIAGDLNWEYFQTQLVNFDYLKSL